MFFNRLITDKCGNEASYTCLIRDEEVWNFYILVFVKFLWERTRSLYKLGIEHKSLILAQIERWRHALHMQVGRQHEYLYLVASGERVSNASECTE